MLRNNISDFNINPLLSELDNVIRKHMNIMLNEYIDRFNLLEQTHRQIMNLPSVVDELRRYTGMSRNSGCEKSCAPAPTDNSSEQLRRDVAAIKNKLDSIESYLQRNTTHTHPNTTSNIVQPSIVLSCVNENIHFEMKEEENSNSSAMCSDDIEADIESGAEEEEEEEEEEEPSTAQKTRIPIEEEEEEEEEEEDEEEEDEEPSTAPKTIIPEEEEEEVETEEEEEEVETEEEEEEEEVKEEKKGEVEEEEEELVEIEIDDITYCTNDEENGFIYELSEEGEVGDKVGYLKEGEPFFYADEN
jgi:hypothetical protein